jgi:hypothetical protein
MGGYEWLEGYPSSPEPEYLTGERRLYSARIPRSLMRRAKVWAVQAELTAQELAVRVFDWYIRSGHIPPPRENARYDDRGFLEGSEQLSVSQSPRYGAEAVMNAYETLVDRHTRLGGPLSKTGPKRGVESRTPRAVAGRHRRLKAQPAPACASAAHVQRQTAQVHRAHGARTAAPRLVFNTRDRDYVSSPYEVGPIIGVLGIQSFLAQRDLLFGAVSRAAEGTPQGRTLSWSTWAGHLAPLPSADGGVCDSTGKTWIPKAFRDQGSGLWGNQEQVIARLDGGIGTGYPPRVGARVRSPGCEIPV